MYYGIQLKPIDEYTRGFDATGEISTQDEGYRKLFDENTAELDDEVAKDFERLQKERRRRVGRGRRDGRVWIFPLWKTSWALWPRCRSPLR